jgi:hypothetical protein
MFISACEAGSREPEQAMMFIGEPTQWQSSDNRHINRGQSIDSVDHGDSGVHGLELMAMCAAGVADPAKMTPG